MLKQAVRKVMQHTIIYNNKFELMLTRCVKAYSSPSSVYYLKIGVFTLS